MDDESDTSRDIEQLDVDLQTLEAKVDQVVLKRLEALETTVDEQSETIESLTDELEDCQDYISVLEQRLAGLAGLQEEEKSTPEKRREDLVLSLQRKAKDGAGKDANGRASMTYDEILDQWAILNHGEVSPKLAYRAMDKVANIDGITVTTNASDQKVVRMNLEKFDSSTALGGVDNVNNAKESDGSTNAVSPSD